MKLQLFLVAIFLTGSYGSNKTLYLVDLYSCVNEFEEYCDRIPQWTVRAAVGLANECDDILPGYTLSTLNKDLRPNNSLIVDGEVITVVTAGATRPIQSRRGRWSSLIGP